MGECAVQHRASKLCVKEQGELLGCGVEGLGSSRIHRTVKGSDRDTVTRLPIGPTLYSMRFLFSNFFLDSTLLNGFLRRRILFFICEEVTEFNLLSLLDM